jgi:hypothetical protein
MPLQAQYILDIETEEQALPLLSDFKADTSTFLTEDSPVPSDSLVNLRMASLSPSCMVCEVTVSAIIYSL